MQFYLVLDEDLDLVLDIHLYLHLYLNLYLQLYLDLEINLNQFFFVPKYKLLIFCTTLIPPPEVANLIKSGVADKAALVFLLAAALPILLAIFIALTGLKATFFPKLTVALPTLDLFLLHLTQLPFNILVPFEVIKSFML